MGSMTVIIRLEFEHSSSCVVVHEAQREDKVMFLVEFLDAHHQCKKRFSGQQNDILYLAND